MQLIFRLIWVILGTFSGALGAIGLMLPIVPQVPFILFAIYCFARASQRFRVWINERPLYRKYKLWLLRLVTKHRNHTKWHHRLIVWCCQPLLEI